MMRWAALCSLVLGEIVLSRPAHAERIDLVLDAPPIIPVSSLRMRATDGTPRSAELRIPVTRARVARRKKTQSQETDIESESRILFRFNLGYGIDGGEPRPESYVEREAHKESNWRELRQYTFGDLVVGSRGLVAQELNTYFASQFRLDQTHHSAAVPSVYDGDVQDVLVRSAYGEMEDFFRNQFLRPIYFRAGRQFRYGPAVAHFDGLTMGYDTPGFEFAVFSGQRVSLYGVQDPQLLTDQGLITGGSAKFDMFALRKVPLVVNGSLLRFDEERHFEGGVALRWSRDVLLRASIRVFGRSLVRQRLAMRARISTVTTVAAELENRGTGDWSYDLIIPGHTYSTDDPRNYLNLGVPLPRLYLNLRAGTVLMDNVDLLLRGGAAVDRSGEGQFNTFSASYVEAGGALEVRLRRAILVGASALTRRLRRRPPTFLTDAPLEGPSSMLPADTGELGERSFLEAGMSGRYSTGARRFSASAEFYTRIYQPQSPYTLPEKETTDSRNGGRFSVDGWAGKKLRLKAEYDIAFSPKVAANELRSLKSLRVVAEGAF